MITRPTNAEKADAVMRLLDELDAAHGAIRRALTIMGERAERGSSSGAGPLFPYPSEKAVGQITEARAALWEARKIVAPQYLDAVRAGDPPAPSDEAA